MMGDTSVAHAIERYAQRRALGTPTPVVLVGAEAHAAWSPYVDVAADPEAAARGWLDAVREDLTAALRARVEALRGASSRHATAFERGLWADVSADVLLAAGDTDGALLLRDASSPLRALAAAVRVLGTNAPRVRIDGDELDAAVRAAIALAETAPKLAVAVSTTAGAWQAWARAPGHEHAKARLCVCGNASAPGAADVERVPRALATARVLAAEARRAPSAVADEAARSAAERALFEALEAHPISAGRFVLNHALAVAFGTRALEVDLACASLRLAVEVDGYFHFRDQDAYRRDRRKDVALQRDGYFVVRVLADDVVTRLEEVVRIIHETIAFLSKGERR